jgi:hypothetical protein
VVEAERLKCCFGWWKSDLARVFMGCKFWGGRTVIARDGGAGGVAG